MMWTFPRKVVDPNFGLNSAGCFVVVVVVVVGRTTKYPPVFGEIHRGSSSGSSGARVVDSKGSGELVVVAVGSSGAKVVTS